MTPQQIEALKLALEAMKNNKPTHLYCEDIWYSCPKHEDGFANEREGDECNCGADEINAEFDKAITALEEVLAEHAMQEVQRLGQEIEQEPCVHAKNPKGCYRVRCQLGDKCVDDEMSFRTAPPQRKPLSAEQVDKICAEWTDKNGNTGYSGRRQIAQAIEAAHGIKENT